MLVGVATFAPPSYFTMGATYAAVAPVGHRILAQDERALIWLLPSALVALCAIPTIVFVAVDPPTRRYLRERFGTRTAPSPEP